jgi:photosystem II stability/assembly factor-like uncharacterized protein
MRRLPLLFLALVAIVSGCTSTTEPNDDPGTTPGEVAVTAVTGLPTVGGNVKAIALESDGSAVALIDGGLFRIVSLSATPQRIGSLDDYLAFGLSPSGDLYAITATEIHSFDAGSELPRIAMIDPAGPLSTNGRVESASIDFGAGGTPYITMISNYPRMYLYRTSDRGATWSSVTIPDAQFMTAIAFARNGTMYGASSQSFYVSTDEGVTWQTKPPVVRNYSGTMRVTRNGTIYYWLPQIGSLHVSRDEGTTFMQLSPFNQAPFPIDIREGAGGTLYGLWSKGGQLNTSQPGWLSTSTDGGSTWNRILNANGRALAVSGEHIAVGLAGDERQLGGIYWSADAGSTWSASGLRPGLMVNDIAFDRDRTMLALIDNVLFRRTTSGWQLLGSQGQSYTRVAANAQGTIVAASGYVVYTSTNNGATWRDSAITDYLPGTSGFVMTPALVALPDGSFLLSVVTYDQSGEGYHAGVLYRIGADGAPVRITGVGHTFRSLVVDRTGTIYGSEERLNPITQTFSSELYTSTDAATWTLAPAGTRSGSSYNSHNRYVRMSGQSELKMGSSSGGDETTLNVTGLPVTLNLVNRILFGPDDKLHFTPMEGGLYTSTTAQH